MDLENKKQNLCCWGENKKKKIIEFVSFLNPNFKGDIMEDKKLFIDIILTQDNHGDEHGK